MKHFFTIGICLAFFTLVIVSCGPKEDRPVSSQQKDTETYKSDNINVERMDPPFWWVGMPVHKLQIMLYGENLSQSQASLGYPGVTIDKQEILDSPNYLILNLTLDPKAQPGVMNIQLQQGDQKQTVAFELKSRESGEKRNQGFDASDVIYLMMPDRFANGDPSNDSVEGMLEGVDRSKPGGRHGGDLQGIRDHLDYIKELGMTAVWFTPVFENDMKPEYGGYHGYAITDMYKIDRRYGSNEEFKSLVDFCHENDIKVIMDMIHNHIGDQHWWMKDYPTKDWIHDLDTYGTNHFKTDGAADPYQSQNDFDKLVRSWFVNELPDMDQRVPQLADYLIQNTLWWIEYSGIDGVRMDTHVYPYKEYMARWAKEVLEAYPTFNIVGEAWVNSVPQEAYWQYDLEGQDDGYNSYLPSVTDFPVSSAMEEAFKEEFSFHGGLSKLWKVLGQDMLYADPMKNVIFMDNHDKDRFYKLINRNKEHFKMAYAFLMTTRGIPQVYYGTELMFDMMGEGDVGKRPDMPGGWEGDTRSIFTKEGRTDSENEIFEYVKALTNWRKSATAIHNGKLLHFVPLDNEYVFFRINDESTVMVVLNTSTSEKILTKNRFDEILKDFKQAKNVLTGEITDVTKDFSVPAKSASVFELQ